MARHRLIRLHQGHLQAQGPANAEAITLRDLFEERAGILEHDAGIDRAEAERLAFAEVVPPALQAGAA